MFAAATFTLGVGDLGLIVCLVTAATVFIVTRLTRIPIQIRAERDAHEEKCENFEPARKVARLEVVE